MKKIATIMLVVLALSMLAGVASAGVYKPDPILEPTATSYAANPSSY